MNSPWVQRYFSAKLIDLGIKGDSKYDGIYQPEPELDLPKSGVTAEFLEKSEQYFEKYQQFDLTFKAIQRELEPLSIGSTGIVVDFGSGFGNTVIPILASYSGLRVIGTDISPDLLTILKREATKRRLNDRCAAVAMDAQRDYFEEGFADIALGRAILHHMVDPEKVIRTAIKVLKPGGHAIFIEPFQIGNSVLRIAYTEILNEARRRDERGPGLDFLSAFNMDIAVRTRRQHYPGFEQKWYEIDDKWLFTKSYLEHVAKACASDVSIHSLNDPQDCFSRQTKVALSMYGGLSCPEALPQWAWEILEHYDNDCFSSDMKQDLLMDGAVIFTK